jgi:hypothetical protein
MSPTPSPRAWHSALPDLVAFLVGLAVVWAQGWNTTDLIWSLWLSSLVVGYALIVWALLQPALELLGLGWQHRAEVEASPAWNDRKQLVLLLAIALVGGTGYLAFFTIHFGGFHLGQAAFLLDSYPLGFPFHEMNRATFAEVLRRYWGALPSAFLARRHAFMRRVFAAEGRAGSGVDSARDTGRGERSRWDELAESRVTGPYLQVMRMHFLIIALGILHAARRDSFAVFAVIYAVYFFPWRLVRGKVAASTDPAVTVTAS